MQEPQGTKTKKEGAVPTSEGAGSTRPKEGSTGKTYNEEDFQRAVSKGLESTTRQLSLQKAEAKKFKAEAEQSKAETESLNAELRELTAEFNKLSELQFANDPEAREAFLSKRAIAEDKRRLAKEKAEVERKLYDAEMTAWSARMAQKAGELVKETGIDVKELEDCQTEEEMEVKALRFKITQSTDEKPPKFASPGGGGEGRNLNDMSPRELIKLGVQQKKK